MRHQRIPLIIILLLFTIFANTASAQQSVSEKFKQLEWLRGKWNRTNAKPGESGYEVWSAAKNNGMFGKGVTLKGEEPVFIEELELSIKGEDIYYMVRVPDEVAPIPFKLTSISKDAFTCENPEHDFPKKIAYTRNGKKAKAVISGDGKSIDYDFEFVTK